MLDGSNSARCVENPQDSHQRQPDRARGISFVVSPNNSSSFDFEASQLTSKSKLTYKKSGHALLEQPTLVASKRPF